MKRLLPLLTLVLAGCGAKDEPAAPAAAPAAVSSSAPAPAAPGGDPNAAPPATSPYSDASNQGMQSVQPGEAGSR